MSFNGKGGLALMILDKAKNDDAGGDGPSKKETPYSKAMLSAVKVAVSAFKEGDAEAANTALMNWHSLANMKGS